MYWSNGGMKVMEAINHFLISSESPQKNTTTIVLLHKHAVKLPPKYWFLPTDDLNLCQRSLFLQWAEVNTETHNWSKYYDYECFPLNRTFVSFSILQSCQRFREYHRRSRKECKGQRMRSDAVKCMATALMHSQQLWLTTQDPHKIKSVKIPAPFLAEKLLAVNCYWGREFFFLWACGY